MERHTQIDGTEARLGGSRVCEEILEVPNLPQEDGLDYWRPVQKKFVEEKPMATSQAWKGLEKRVVNWFQENYGPEGIIRRNLRGANFAESDSDVDVLNIEDLYPGFVIECKYRSGSQVWLHDVLKREHSKFKKTKFDKAGLILVLTVWLPMEGEQYKAFHCVDLNSFDTFWNARWNLYEGYPEEWINLIYNVHVKANANNEYYIKTLDKVRKEYIPMKAKISKFEEPPMPLLAQTRKNSSIIAVLMET